METEFKSKSAEKRINSAIYRLSKEFHLSDISESSLPDRFNELCNLRRLQISGSRNLTKLPDSLFRMENLKFLDIVNCPIEFLTDIEVLLPSLKYLRLRKLPLVNLPDSIFCLENLETIHISQCSLTKLPSSIGSLKNLKELDLIGLKISKLPADIGELKSLERLNITSNRIVDLPESIGSLSKLQSLVLLGNKVRSFPSSIGNLKSLDTLNVSHNNLQNLPKSMRNIKSLREFDITGNTALGIPVEVGKDKPAQVFDFFFRAGPRRMLQEAKILLIGQGGVGKTSLVNRLLDNKFDEAEAKTEGIRVRGWEVGEKNKKIRLNVWDFGGQEIMHATHQFFLTKRSLYILVLDARAGERESNIHYWLEMIRVYGANSPLIVVLNKSEQHHEELDVNRLKLDYEGIVNFQGFHSVSCLTGAGIKPLLENIDGAVHRLPHVWDYLPEDYFSIKNELESLSDTTDFITEEEYSKTCCARRVTDTEEQKRLLRFLHDVGCVLHYDDPDQRYHVHDTRVLNPSWVTSGVYKVLNDPIFLRNGTGVIRRSDLARILDSVRYPSHRYPFLIDIMKKYELCIEIPDGDSSVLVPELLSKNEPDVGWASPK